MPTYRAPLRDTRYVLDHVLRIGTRRDLPGCANAVPDTVDAVLTAGARFCETVLFPLNAPGDRAGCVRRADGSVTTPPGFRDAYRRFVAEGWPALGGDGDMGGAAMPHAVTTAFREYVVSANMAFALYDGLNRAAVAAIMAAGSEEQRRLYVPPMIAGEWSGTMNLTEPQCGTDLGLIRTRAVARGGGGFAITGTKIFISSGEHDLTANIIHLVLARIDGAPAGTKGLSLFVVPKFLPDADGAPSVRNALSCISIEDKMGVHANPTCTMDYDGATGFLLGEPGRGLPAMFVMMNAARLSVGMQGLAMGEVAYQNAVAHAGTRRQGRAPGGPADPDADADPLFVHPDVRRILAEAKARLEAARALCLWAAVQVDLAHHAGTAAERESAADLLSLLTPVVKAHLTDMGHEIATAAQQVHGGHGYIRATGVEQYVRDARVAQIYEGANGVQAMGLVRRGIGRDGGRALAAFMTELDAAIAGGMGDPATVDFAARLDGAGADLSAASAWLAGADAEDAGAAAYPYMTLMGIVALGWMWMLMAQASARAIAAGADDPAFHATKLMTARVFAERVLPDTAALRRRVESGGGAVMALPVEAFR